MDFVKHECGVAMVRLLKSEEHFQQRYGDAFYGLHLLEKMLVRQYNRGQDGAGIGCIDIAGRAPRVFQMKQEGADAVEKISARIEKEIASEREWGSSEMPFYGDLMLGHVRYSTTGLTGECFLHPFRHDHQGDNPESLMICGNFHLINTSEIYDWLDKKGVESNPQADTHVLLKHIAYHTWDKEGKRLNTETALEATSPKWDGGFVICGINTNGEWWAVRDSHGIRPAFWYADDEKVVVASEKSAISLSAGIDPSEIRQLMPGVMIKVNNEGKISFKRVIEQKPIRECVFERIYFSRADGGEITLEREKLGNLLAQHVEEIGNHDVEDTFFSFVPASARSAFLGMVAHFADVALPVDAQSLAGDYSEKYSPHVLLRKDGKKVNFGRLIEKGKALRTFISTEKGRENLVEKSYIKMIPQLPEGINRIVIVDDSIVRGTTLKSSVISILDTYNPKEIVVVSCTPQVRYPDFYGIDMSRLGELIAFRAAVNIATREGKGEILDEIYRQSKLSLEKKQRTKNFVRLLYAQMSGHAISEEIARMVTPDNCKAKIKVVYLSMEDLRMAIPDHTGDWCFSGNYPTSGAYAKICQAFVNYYEGKADKR